MRRDSVDRFMKLFQGYQQAHGQYRVQKREADGKMSGRAVTVSEAATKEHFESHLKGGDYILGIIMLKDDNSCNFGVIDIDIRLDTVVLKFSPSRYLAPMILTGATG